MAAARELGIRSPFLEAGIGKEMIRSLAKYYGLPNWDKPSSPCLASRIPYGEVITPERLQRIDRSEALLRGMGFRQLRVRDHATLARVEVPPEDMGRLLDLGLREAVVAACKNAGYIYVTLDLQGYRTGAMNEAVTEKERTTGYSGMKHIYLDNNATTRLHPEVLEQMLPYLSGNYGNPLSIHWFGQEARRAMDGARGCVADFINASSDEIVFTSGGTEADNQAIMGIADALGKPGSRIITTAIEHQAVLSCCRQLEKKGFLVTYLPVDSKGRIDLETLADSIDDDVILISVMFANNEVGTIQPIREAAEISKSRGILFHTDAVQAAGKIPLDVRNLGVDLLSLSAHKFHGPKGCGALFVRSGIDGPVLIHGGHHERRRRAGTENVAAIAGFGHACRRAGSRIEETNQITGSLRDRLEEGILERVPESMSTGAGKTVCRTL